MSIETEINAGGSVVLIGSRLWAASKAEPELVRVGGTGSHCQPESADYAVERTCPGQEEPAVFGVRAILAQRIRVELMENAEVIGLFTSP